MATSPRSPSTSAVPHRTIADFTDWLGDAISRAVTSAIDDVIELAVAPADPTQIPAPTPPAVSEALDPYVVVGVDRAAPWAEVAAAYRRRASNWHPDGADHPDDADVARRQDLTRELNVAYAMLGARRARLTSFRDGGPTPSLCKHRSVPRHGTDDDEGPSLLDAPENAWWALAPSDPFERDEPFLPVGDDDEGEGSDGVPAGPSAGVDPGAEAGPTAVTNGTPEPNEPFNEPFDDPYRVLRVSRQAPWEEIVASYRTQARWWHPDGLVGATDDERALCEARFGELTAAYQELRVRRGR